MRADGQRRGFKVNFLRMGLIIVLLLSVACSPPVTTAQVIAEITGKAEKIETYKVDMTMEMSMMGKMVATKTEITFKEPEKMRMKSSFGGMKQEMVSDGKTLWTYMPAMNMVGKIDMSSTDSPMTGAGAGMGSDITEPFNGYPKEGLRYIETRIEDGVQVYVLEAIPPDLSEMPEDNPMAQMMPKKIVLMISTASGLPHKTQMLTEDGTLMMQMKYSNFRINIPIDDSEFEFTPPPGAQIMDMTKGSQDMRRAMRRRGTKGMEREMRRKRARSLSRENQRRRAIDQ